MASTETKAEDPRSLITEARMRAVLARDLGSEARLHSFAVKDFTEKGDNFATLVTSVNVKYSLQGKEQLKSYVVKLFPSIILPVLTQFIPFAFLKEAKFFEELRSELSSELTAVGQSGLRMPKCFQTSLEKDKEIIVLEDLRPRGFQMHHCRKDMDVAHTNLVLQELARLHAASLLLQAKSPHQKLADRFDFLNIDLHNFSSQAKECIHFFFSMHIENGTAMIHELQGYEVVEQWLDKIRDNTHDLFVRHLARKAPFEVLCHGDCWKNNLLFRYNVMGDPIEVMLLDLQLCRISSPATDLTYVMHTSLHGDVKKANIENFLATYYNTFSKVMEAGGLASPFTLQELHQEYRNKQEFGLLFGTLSALINHLKDDDFPDITEVKEEDMPSFVEEMKKKSVNILKSNPEFQSRFRALFVDMVEK